MQTNRRTAVCAFPSPKETGFLLLRKQHWKVWDGQIISREAYTPPMPKEVRQESSLAVPGACSTEGKTILTCERDFYAYQQVNATWEHQLNLWPLWYAQRKHLSSLCEGISVHINWWPPQVELTFPTWDHRYIHRDRYRLHLFLFSFTLNETRLYSVSIDVHFYLEPPLVSTVFLFFRLGAISLIFNI